MTKKNNLKISLFSFLTLSSLLFVLNFGLFALSYLPAFDYDLSNTGTSFEGQLPNPLGENTTFETIIRNIFGWLVKIATVVVPIIIIIGAFQMLFSAGDPAKFNKGKSTILWAVVGYIIILLAYGIADLIKSIISGA